MIDTATERRNGDVRCRRHNDNPQATIFMRKQPHG
jgi:hypothetical protein